MTNLTPKECSLQFHNLDLHTQRCLIAIVKEMQRAEEKHPRWPVDKSVGFDKHIDGVLQGEQDYVYGAGIVSEEAGELMKACIQYQYEGRRYNEIESEAIQTGAMALRFLKNLPVVQDWPSRDEQNMDLPNAQEYNDRMIEYQKLK
jgi:hypothetical protein